MKNYLFNIINIWDEQCFIKVRYQCLPEKKFVLLTWETLHCLIFSRSSHLCALLRKEVVLRVNEPATSMGSPGVKCYHCNSWSTGTPAKVIQDHDDMARLLEKLPLTKQFSLHIPPSTGAKFRTDEQLLWLPWISSYMLACLCEAPIDSFSSVSLQHSTNSRDSVTVPDLGCSHRSVIPAVA